MLRNPFSRVWQSGIIVLNCFVFSFGYFIPLPSCTEDTIEPCRNHPTLPESIICDNVDMRTFLQVIRCATKRNIHEVFLEDSSIDYLPLVKLDFCGFYFLNVKSVVLSTFLEGNEMIRLKQLHLDDVKIENSWDWSPLSVLRRLQRFALSNILLRALDWNLVDHLNENLLSLSLTSTNTTEIEDGAFVKFSNMEYISVQDNHVGELKRSMFPTPAKIKYFHFGRNKISSLPTDLFDQMPELETIGLQGNLISVIYDASFKNSLSNLRLVSLEGNPLKCNCKMLWLLKKNVPAIFKGECYSPKRDFGKQLTELKATDFQC